ncbi:hypothetical protein, partial [Bartonella sp. CL29QHWL]|uniref:hypothetical protein n=1 Tax=Bartonella sp. CL29QHWL TaxID=3243522 RepID=UPI0035D11F11
CFSLSFSEMAVLVFVCQEHGKWCLEEKEEGGRGKEGGADACEGVVHAGVLLGCMLECPVGMPVWRGWVCCQRVCFSLSFSEMAVLMSACQEHGKWCLEKRRKAERRNDARRAGWVCLF